MKTNIKLLSLSLLLSFFILPSACSTSKVQPLQPAARSYLTEDLYAKLKGEIPDYPKKGSAAQASDEAELHQLQKTRSNLDCQRAATEVVITLQSFYGKPYGDLTPEQVEKLNPFFEHIRESGGPYIGQIKKGYTRTRPYDYIKGLTPCIAKEPSYAYPSGHATLASLYSLVLIDLFPENKLAIQTRAQQIAQDRVLAGVHHPTDIQAGNKLGALIHDELIKSQTYQADLVKYQASLKPN